MRSQTENQPAQKRYTLVPQMRHYDRLDEKTWLPYVMFFQPPDVATPSFTTDSHGFRGTLWKGKRLSFAQYNESDLPRAALVGASVPFGVGATSDGGTLASRLNESGDRIWFNFSGRAFNSTQEWVIFMLHLPRSVKTVLIFSGINNLVLSQVAAKTSPIYNCFYAQSVFERGLRRGSAFGVRGSLKLLFSEIGRQFSHPNGGRSHVLSVPAYEAILESFRRDMRVWTLLRESLGFELQFVFQPIAPWITKALVPQERELFGLLNELDPTGMWDSISACLQDQGKQYLRDIRRVCEEEKVPFLDMNQSPSFREPQWLFVDRAHLTDQGYALVAEEIGQGCLR